MEMENDLVSHPKHYTAVSVQLEPIDVLRHAPFDLGNALKYVLRAPHKGNALLDYQKALQYLEWAKEGCYINFKPYKKFINHYGLLLKKFNTLKNIDVYNIYYLFDSLESLINSKIKELEK